jgi:S-adenosyl methyltransferase
MGVLVSSPNQEQGFSSVDPASPPEINTSVAHPARRYDYWLGGKDNFPADQASGDAIEAAFPTIRMTVMENRRFLVRAVRFLAGELGIRQFLDIGTGIPTSPNVHEVAQSIAPDSRVVYVDNDPIVLAHARALLRSGPQGATAYMDADLREPDKILQQPDLLRTLDLSQPVVSGPVPVQDQEGVRPVPRRARAGTPGHSAVVRVACRERAPASPIRSGHRRVRRRRTDRVSPLCRLGRRAPRDSARHRTTFGTHSPAPQFVCEHPSQRSEDGQLPANALLRRGSHGTERLGYPRGAQRG